MDLTRKCIICGKEITDSKRKRLCSPKCHPGFGKKRPEHSKFMKKFTADGHNQGAIKKGELRNAYVNSVSFKEKVMDTAKFEINPTLSIKENFSLYNSAKSKTIEYKMKTIEKELLKFDSDLNLLFVKFLNSREINENNIQEIFPIFWGLRTIFYRRKQKKIEGGVFKKVFLDGFKYNTQGITSVLTRSSYEANYIKLFEKNKIHWSYEELTLLCTDGLGHYTPDFIINYNNIGFIIEVKGSWYRRDKKEYFEQKLNAADRKSTRLNSSH